MEDFIPPGLNRDASPINRTEAALLSRGVDSGAAARLRKEGWTLAKLMQQSDAQLEELYLSSEAIKSIRTGRRPGIPFEDLVQVLVANRFTCCVCHDPKKAIVVHHIREWSKSHDHSPSNLAVLCLDDHGKAHTVSSLTRNLDESKLTHFKEKWEAEICRTNTEAILEASRVKADAWWYFNHVRLLELAIHLNVPFKKLPHYATVLAHCLIQPDGGLAPRSSHLSYMYSGAEGMILYGYVREIMNAVLERLTVLNISDYLDRGVLAPVLKAGDFIFVQGAHTFKAIDRRRRGRGQTWHGVRKANHVEVSFTFDRWEATSGSAWGSWLSRRKEAASILRIVNVQKVDDTLLVEGTVIGIAFALEGLKEREYASFPYRSGVLVYDEADDDSFWDD